MNPPGPIAIFDDVPESGTVANILLWVYQCPDPECPENHTLYLNGPEWTEVIEFEEPDYQIPWPLLPGLHICECRFDFDLDANGDPFGFRYQVLRTKHLIVPTRDDLTFRTFDDFLGVMA